MKIFSEKINYSLSALFELARNHHKGFIQISEIAKAQNIPQNYLEQLLLTLKRAELVESMRGAQGGYKLKKNPAKIKIYDIIQAFENPINVVDYSNNIEILKSFWKKIEIEFKELFQTTLEDLVHEESNMNKRLSFQI